MCIQLRLLISRLVRNEPQLKLDQSLQCALDQLKQQPSDKKIASAFLKQFLITANREKIPMSRRASELRALLARAGIQGERPVNSIIGGLTQSLLTQPGAPKEPQRQMDQRGAFLPKKHLLALGSVSLLALSSISAAAYYYLSQTKQEETTDKQKPTEPGSETAGAQEPLLATDSSTVLTQNTIKKSLSTGLFKKIFTPVVLNNTSPRSSNPRALMRLDDEGLLGKNASNVPLLFSEKDLRYPVKPFKDITEQLASTLLQNTLPAPLYQELIAIPQEPRLSINVSSAQTTSTQALINSAPYIAALATFIIAPAALLVLKRRKEAWVARQSAAFDLGRRIL